MTDLEKTYLRKHLETYFEQPLHHTVSTAVSEDPRIDLMVFEPTEKYPFWKLVTMGASDHKMPELNPNKNPYVPMRNEYMMFLDKDMDLSEESADWHWYAARLMDTAIYPAMTGNPLSFGYAFKLPDRGEEMEGVVLLFPQAIQDTRVMKCQIGLFRPCALVQVMPVTGEELELRKEIGPEAFMHRFYPEDPNEPMHPLAQKSRKH